MAKEIKPPKKIVVSWTEEDWSARWPHRFESMIGKTPLSKAPFIASLIKSAVQEFEATGKVPGRYNGKKPKKSP